jgi:hypothetical protein
MVWGISLSPAENIHGSYQASIKETVKGSQTDKKGGACREFSMQLNL